MSKPTVYSVASYGDMINSEPRMPAFDAALRAAVTPGCRVIDLGAGTGIFSLLACKYGAAEVTAIEPADAVLILRDAARANGCADRITVIQGLSSDHAPPHKADVLVSDLRGALPLYEHHIATIVDARNRLLRPGGVQIPMRDTLRIALVHAPNKRKAIDEPWLNNAYDLDLSVGHRHAVNVYSKVGFEADALLSEAVDLAVLDYRTISDPDLTAKVVLTPKGAVEAHGLLIWFDAELAPGIGYSNAPGEPELVYGQTFFPFEATVTLASEDRVEVEIKAKLVGNSYVWSWNSRVFRGAATAPERTMRQSSFLADVLSPTALARRGSGHVPAPGPAHAIDARVLALVDGTNSLGAIAEALQSEFPSSFATPKAALDHVADLVERYYLKRVDARPGTSS